MKGVLGRKPQSGNFLLNFPGPWHKNYRSDPKKLGGAKMGQTSSMRTQSLVEIGGRMATGDKKQRCFLFVLMFECFCHAKCPERGPGVQQRIMP